MLFFLAHVRCDLTKKRSPKNNCVLERRKRRTKKIQKGFVISSLKVDKILYAPAKTLARHREDHKDGRYALSIFLSLFFHSVSLFLSLSLLMIYFRLCFASRCSRCARSSIFEYIFPTEETHLSVSYSLLSSKRAPHRRRGVPHQPERRFRRGRVGRVRE
jgi:hypothetical protein